MQPTSRTIVLAGFFLLAIACLRAGERTATAEASLFSSEKKAVPEKTAAPATGLLFQSDDDGLTWADASPALPEKAKGIFYMFANEKTVMALSNEDGLYRQTPNGWAKELMLPEGVHQLYEGPGGLFASGYGNGLWQKAAGSFFWLDLAAGLPDRKVRHFLQSPGGDLFAGLESGLFKSTDGGKSWRSVFPCDGINGIAEAEDGGIVCANMAGLMRSADGGETWQQTQTGHGAAFGTEATGWGTASILDGFTKWEPDAGKRTPNRLALSPDGGKTWQLIHTGLAFSRDIYDIEQAGRYLLCSTDRGISRSADGGQTWELVRERAVDSQDRLMLAVSGRRIFVYVAPGC